MCAACPWGVCVFVGVLSSHWCVWVCVAPCRLPLALLTPLGVWCVCVCVMRTSWCVCVCTSPHSVILTPLGVRVCTSPPLLPVPALYLLPTPATVSPYRVLATGYVASSFAHRVFAPVHTFLIFDRGPSFAVCLCVYSFDIQFRKVFHFCSFYLLVCNVSVGFVFFVPRGFGACALGFSVGYVVLCFWRAFVVSSHLHSLGFCCPGAMMACSRSSQTARR